MEHLLEILIESIGPIGSSLITLVVVLVWLYKKELLGLLKSFKSKEETQFEVLKNHDIFSTCMRVKKEVSLLKFYTHGEYDATKTKMCIDFAEFKINVCQENFVKILDEDLKKMSVDALKIFILERMNFMHETYIAQIKEHWRDRGIENEDVLYIISLFEKFRYDVICSFEHRINSIFASNFHEDNFERVLAVFEMWAMGIDLLPKDMHTTFEALNGKFREIDY